MPRVLTESVILKDAIETSLGTLPADPDWVIDEFNSIGAYGAAITSVVRRPVSQDRGRQKGTVVDLDASVEFETDLTFDAFARFAAGFTISEYANEEFFLRETYGSPSIARPPRVDGTAEEFDIDAASTLLAGKMVYDAAGAITLVWSKGYTNAANNGLHVLSADVAGSGTAVPVATDLVDETSPPAGAVLEVCGVRVTDGDLSLSAPSGGQATLTSAADITDWSTLGVQVGQYIHIGSPDTSGVVQNALMDSASDDTFGYARVRSIASNVLTLDKLGTALDSAANNTSEGVADVMFGRFARDVPSTANSDDNRYKEESRQFELQYTDMDGAGSHQYEYTIGCLGNEITLTLGLAAKGTMSLGFVGTNADNLTGTAKSNSGNARDLLRRTAFNTSSDVASLTTDLVSSASDVCFKSVGLTLLNNISPEKCIGTLGATFINVGLFEGNMEGQMAFTSASIRNAVRNNTTVTFATILANEDGAIVLDMPEATASGAGLELPRDATVLANLTLQSFTSDTFGFNLGISLFPCVPGVLSS